MWPHRRDAGAHTSAIESRVRAEAHHETEHDIVVPAPAAGVTDPRPYRIVVGIDGSPGSLDALRWAANEARARGATLVVVHSWYRSTPAPAPLPGPAPELRCAGQHVLDAAIAAVDLSGIQAESLLLGGSAAQRLVQQSLGADLLVVGCRGRGAVAGLRPGSVSLHCVVQSACPVVVIPPQRRATGHGEPGVHADSVVSSG